MKINGEILKQMKKIYYPKDKEYMDWMGFKITNQNYPSYHHIVKVEVLKQEKADLVPTVSNGAYLGKKSHELLHRIEQYDKNIYEAWNKLFLIINKMQTYPEESIWDTVFELQEKTLDIDKTNKKIR